MKLFFSLLNLIIHVHYFLTTEYLNLTAKGVEACEFKVLSNQNEVVSWKKL